MEPLLPVDVVYTWVNGSDPQHQQGSLFKLYLLILQITRFFSSSTLSTTHLPGPWYDQYPFPSVLELNFPAQETNAQRI